MGSRVKPGDRNWPRRVRVVAFALFLASLLAWIAPREKPDAVLGRLGYYQFITASVLTMCWLVGLTVALLPSASQKPVLYRAGATGIGLVIALTCGEFLCWFVPSAPVRNPWLIESADRVHEGTPGLIYEREPYVYWRGLSTGMLATRVGMEDPYAEIVEFSTDFQGFRNGRDIRKADVVFIGDSFTEAGYLAEQETFPHLVASRMNVAARNLGRINYSPSEELVVFQRYGLACEPRVVVWQLCEDNDLWGESMYTGWLAAGMPNFVPPSKVRSDAWQARSPTYRLFAACRRREPWPYSGFFRDADGKQHLILFGNLVSEQQTPTGNPGWPILERTVALGTELAQLNGIKLVVVLIPMKVRAMGHYVEFSDLTKTHLSRDWDLPEGHTMSHHLRQLCERSGVTFIDATPRLKNEAAAGKLVYLPLDSHLSALGHSVVVDLIVPVVTEALDDVPKKSE